MESKHKKPVKRKTRGLSEMEAVQVGEGLQEGHGQDERERADSILKEKLGLALVPASVLSASAGAAKIRRIPGRKPKASTNTTEQEERHRLVQIRNLIGRGADGLTKTQLLCVIYDLFAEFNSFCRNGLFFSSSERAVLHSLSMGGDAIFVELAEQVANGVYDFGNAWSVPVFDVNDLMDWIGGLDDRIQEHAARSNWHSRVDLAAAGIRASKLEEAFSDKDAYRRIKVALNLEIPGDASKSVSVAATPTADTQNTKDPEASESEPELYPSVSVLDTLKVAAAQLILLRQIADDCAYCPYSSAIESLYLIVRSFRCLSEAQRLPPLVTSLDGIFIGISKRQRRTPLPNLRDEELCIGAADIHEDGRITWI